MILYPVVNPPATITPGANGFPGATGTGFFDFTKEYSCNVYAKNGSSTNATLTVVDGVGHQTPYLISANTPFQLTGIPAKGFQVTGNGSSVVLVISAATPQGPAETFNPAQFTTLTNPSLYQGTFSTGGNNTIFTCPTGSKALFHRIAMDVISGTVSVYVVIVSTAFPGSTFPVLTASSTGDFYAGPEPGNNVTMLPITLFGTDYILMENTGSVDYALEVEVMPT